MPREQDKPGDNVPAGDVSMQNQQKKHPKQHPKKQDVMSEAKGGDAENAINLVEHSANEEGKPQTASSSRQGASMGKDAPSKKAKNGIRRRRKPSQAVAPTQGSQQTTSAAKSLRLTQRVVDQQSELNKDQYWGYLNHCWDSMQDMEDEIAELKTQKTTQQNWNTKLHYENEKLESAYKEQNMQLKQTKNDNAELRTKINDVCAENIEQLSRDRTTADTDDIVQDVFQTLMKQSRDWARKWGKPDWSTTNESGLEKLIESLEDTNIGTMASRVAITAVAKHGIRPFHLLNVIFNHVVCYYTIVRPFAKLGAGNTETSIASTNLAEELVRLMKKSKHAHLL